TASVGIWAPRTARVDRPTSAISSLMHASISRGHAFRCRFKVNGRAHANIVIMRIEEAPRRTPAVGPQHLEEIVVGAKPAGGVQGLCRPCQRDPMYVDAAGLARAGAARALPLIDQLSDTTNAP